jgi:hypothetical protein
MHNISDIKVTVDKELLLKLLVANRDKHKQIVEEARAGYLDKAQKALNERMDQLRKGKIMGLGFALQLPEDYTREYETVITALRMHTGSTVDLDAGSVRTFVEDNWGWKNRFIHANSVYSATAKEMADPNE